MIKNRYSKPLQIVLDQITLAIFHAQISYPRLATNVKNKAQPFGFTHDETVAIAAASQCGVNIASVLEKYIARFGIQFLDMNDKKQDFLSELSNIPGKVA